MTQRFSFPLKSLKTLPAWLTVPLSAFLITRIIVWLGGYFAELMLPSATGDGLWHARPDNIWLDIWARWDSGFYLKIIEEGYFYQVGVQSSVAFFPVYPLFASLLNTLLDNSVLSAVIVSHICLFFALIYLYRLTEFEFDSAAAARAVFYIASFPTAFFFSAVYTESTFILFAIATMYYARTRQWGWAAVMGIMACATRIVGFVLGFSLILEWMRSLGWQWTQIHRAEMWKKTVRNGLAEWYNLVFIGMLALGVLSYMLFLYQNFGDPIAFWTVQSAWGRKESGVIAVIGGDLWKILNQDWIAGKIWWHVAVDISAFIFVIIAGFKVLRRLGASYAIFAFLSILIPANSGSGSLVRYALVIFPVFMMLGWWGQRPWLDRLISTLFCVFLGICSAVFVNWVFMG